MNRKEIEVEKKLLANEKAVLKELKKIHTDAYKELKKQIKLLEEQAKALENDPNATKLRSKIYQIEYKKKLQKQLDDALDVLKDKNVNTVDEFLKQMYKDGYSGNLEALATKGVEIEPKINEKLLIKSITKANHGKTFSERLYKNVDKTKKESLEVIQRGIALGDSYDNIARNIKERLSVSYSNAYRIARTEGGRVGIDGKLDSMQQAIDEGAEIVKEWSAAMDKRTRQTHADLDGQIQLFDKPFKWAGGEVMAPHKFGIAAQDINCRCTILSRPVWDLSDDELKKLNIKRRKEK